MPTTDHLKTATLWVTKLALLTAGGKAPPAKQTIGLYATTLAADLPASVFTEASLKEIAGGTEFFPAYSVLLTALRAWHETETEKRLALPRTAEVQEFWDERENSDAHQQRVAARLASAKEDWSDPSKIRESLGKIRANHPMQLHVGRLLAALVRKHAPDNLGHLPPEFLA